ncbi:MAG TPA: M14 family zinc carboxypeptidase [Longimicrobiaceae bacterium]|nr:M14 family zinc carboxypeptidase [Longimicrobiaceae bacterium]
MHALRPSAALLGLCLTLGAAPLPAQQRAAVPAAAPSPERVLGFRPGADGRLADWAQIVDYFGRLDRASAKVRLDTIGRTALGRPMVMATITSPANMARLAEIRRSQARLADPRGVPQAEIDRVVRTQPAVVFIGASLHGNEIMATQMSMELAHDLATDPALGRALQDVVVLLVPGMNPDGLDITRDWWLRTRNTPASGAAMPWLYHHYVGHDNNRDFFMVTQPETQAVTRVLYERWFPQVVFDVHQMGNRGARFFIPPFADPLNPNVDPLIVRMTNVVGTQMALDLAEAGKTGVSHQETFDLWWHGGGRTVPARHNTVGILSEAASADYGDPIRQHPDSLRQPRTGSMYPEPWAGGEWRPRDIVEYELIAAKSLVRLMHRQREDFVRNLVALARKQVRAGEAGGPFAFVVPADQRDPGSAAELLQTLRRGGVEVHEARLPFRAGGETYSAGTRVVLMAQPFRAHAKDLLEPQRYPERRRYPGGPPEVPYDVAGWTLGMQMGVDVREVAEPFPTHSLARIDSVRVRPGTVIDPGPAYALDPRMNNTHRAVHEVVREGGRVVFLREPLAVGGGRTWPAGAPVVSGVDDLSSRLARWTGEWGVDAVGVGEPASGAEMRRLRVGLYKPWTASMDEGWTRWVFERWGVPFDTLHDAQVRAGGLNDRFDAIVIPSESYRDLMQGPRRAHPDYAGGLGQPGAAALRRFVEEGGTLVLLDRAVELGIRDLGIPVRDVNAAQDTADAARWYAPGSLLRVRWDASHPVAWGMPEESAVNYTRSPVLEVAPGTPGVTVVARYPERDILLSGYSQGEERIAGKAAVVEAQVGRGTVVMFGFRPQYRAQAHETFKPFFNALYRR